MMTTPEPDVIPPEEAREHLRAAITEHLGEDWEDEDSRWTVVTSHAYMARLNRGRYNVDFYVNYFDGSVTVESNEVNSGQETGRMLAWTLLLLFAAIVLILAWNLGLL